MENRIGNGIRWCAVLCLGLYLIMTLIMPPMPTVRAAEGAADQSERQEKENEALRYTDEATGNRVIIEDDADILTDAEELELEERMKKVLGYGSVVFKSTKSPGQLSLSDYAEVQYRRLLKEQSGILILISEQKVRVYCDGRLGRILSQKQVNGIARTVRGYTGRDEYIYGVSAGFDSAYYQLEQNRKAQPVSYICNAMLALIMAMLLNFVLVNMLSKTRKTSESELLEHTLSYCDHSDIQIEFLTRSEVYSPQSKRY